jgi:hypothetical protein
LYQKKAEKWRKEMMIRERKERNGKKKKGGGE